MFKSKIKTLALSISVTVFATSLILMPGESLEASIRGLDMWWEIVFPSLLPFFIVSEMLIGFGVVRFIGVMLEPLMRPLFRVPGVGGFVWAMGMASGFPAGAKLTARLRQEKQITKLEGERLVSFTNSSNPLFIFGAVSVGFFQNATLGIVLAAAHYIGNICVGIVMRFYGVKEKEEIRSLQTKRKGFILREAFSALHRTRLQDKRPIGKLLGDAVTSSIQTLLMIGGFIILFSVINKMLYHLNITTFFAEGLSALFILLQLPDQLSIPFISGLFEITLGSKLTSGVTEATLLHQAIITSFILGFSGFSVQAQVASILADTDIRFKPFFYARIVHGFAASVTTILIWKPIYERFSDEQLSNAIPVFARHNDAFWTDMLYWFKTAGPIITISSLILYMVLYARKHVNH
ncbi:MULTISPECIES: sporulation integral membrane protein YlbJ [Rossellomorea]|uniref:sporulation integral membrane protein YlbJ n=1 Tax=Rossellomorea TaxID=2837508 RepID=UPI001CCAF07A|nr:MULTISPECIES: sporulation integral membrane protein YlbJ [Rossellomorea]MCA0148749.1 sporulation integral membrane protein YlbJ [Rossellomorea vietnamensis]WGG47410.1 sporulation integral membrane protein YlbJ [Rossellomorea sp. DA94]